MTTNQLTGRHHSLFYKCASASWTCCSGSSENCIKNGSTPHGSKSCQNVDSTSVKAPIRTSLGQRAARTQARNPLRVKTMMPEFPGSCASTAEDQNILTFGSQNSMQESNESPTIGPRLSMLFFRTLTHSSGYARTVVSPDGMTASASSPTAWEISEICARALALASGSLIRASV